MGEKTPNMSVYKPSPGETVYDPAFSAGLDRIDAHDHSGAPNKGVQIGTDGIQDGAITPDKLSEDVSAEATGQTTDATPVELVSLPVIEGQAATVQGRAVAMRDDGTEACGGNFMGTFHRITSSSITKVGAEVINFNDNSSGSPIIQLVADTSNEAISIRAAGEAGKTINWTIVYNIIYQPGN